MANPRNTRSGCAGVRFAPSRERDQALTIPFAEGVTEIKKLYYIWNKKLWKLFGNKILQMFKKNYSSYTHEKCLKKNFWKFGNCWQITLRKKL